MRVKNADIVTFVSQVHFIITFFLVLVLLFGGCGVAIIVGRNPFGFVFKVSNKTIRWLVTFDRHSTKRPLVKTRCEPMNF